MRTADRLLCRVQITGRLFQVCPSHIVGAFGASRHPFSSISQLSTNYTRGRGVRGDVERIFGLAPTYSDAPAWPRCRFTARAAIASMRLP